ncbi:hypothetical protein CP02DC22_1126, partial [Chlamydia psittaci 02DC22]
MFKLCPFSSTFSNILPIIFKFGDLEIEYPKISLFSKSTTG